MDSLTQIVLGAAVGELVLGKLKINAGLGFSTELTRGNAAVSYNHRVNSLRISRFAWLVGEE